MTLHDVLKNKNMIEAEWQKRREERQGHSSRSDILPLKWHIFKSKMKESKV